MAFGTTINLGKGREPQFKTSSPPKPHLYEGVSPSRCLPLAIFQERVAPSSVACRYRFGLSNAIIQPSNGIWSATLLPSRMKESNTYGSPSEVIGVGPSVT